MNRRSQDAVCAFVRRVLSARIGEPIVIDDRPEEIHRNIPVVEERWRSASRTYAVEHTQIEAFEGQIQNSATVERFLGPVKRALDGRIHGRYVLRVRESETAAAVVSRDQLPAVHAEIVRLVLQSDEAITPGQTVTLESDRLPFTMDVYLRHRNNTFIALRSDIAGDGAALCLGRVRRAFDEKCPKLLSWSKEGRTSVLVLESNDSDGHRATSTRQCSIASVFASEEGRRLQADFRRRTALAPYHRCAVIMKRVEGYLPTEQGLSATDKGNIRFQVAMTVVALTLGKAKPTIDQISQLNLAAVTDAKISEATAIVRRIQETWRCSASACS